MSKKPDPNCRKCFGEGYYWVGPRTGFNDPTPCDCKEKKEEHPSAQEIANAFHIPKELLFGEKPVQATAQGSGKTLTIEVKKDYEVKVIDSQKDREEGRLSVEIEERNIFQVHIKKEKPIEFLNINVEIPSEVERELERIKGLIEESVGIPSETLVGREVEEAQKAQMIEKLSNLLDKELNKS